MRFVVMLFCTVLFVSSAYAKSCYTMEQAEAEQGIKIKSELMVIGLNCMHKNKPGEANLYNQYHNFSRKHDALFSEYEETIRNYYIRAGVPNPEDRLKTLRTSFANKISGDAASMRPDVFCWHYADRIRKAGQMDDLQVKKWAATIFEGHPVSQPICNN